MFPWTSGLGFVILASSAVAQEWFDTTRHFPLTDRGQIRAAADLDGDGDVDLFWLSQTTRQVWWNVGSGQFEEGPLGTNSTALVISQSYENQLLYPSFGDVNGDGRIDIVVATNLTPFKPAVAVFINMGGGVFAQSMTYLPLFPFLFAGSVQALTVANIDADPEIEIATAQDASLSDLVQDTRTEIRWWNWSAGQLVGNSASILDGALAECVSLAAFDAGNDGVSDLLIAGYPGSFQPGPGTVGLLLTVHGTPTLGQTISTTSPRVRLTSGDLESDGDLDVIGCSRSTCSDVVLQVFANAGGNLVHGPEQSLALGESYCLHNARVVLGDHDADGDLDAFVNQFDARLFENDGSNQFVVAGKQITEFTSTFAGEAVACADFDGDGRDELVTPRGIVFTRGQPLADLPQVFANPPSPISSWYACDLEGDGDTDLIGESGRIAMNDATGAWVVSLTWPTFPGVAFVGPTGVGDFDQDGRLDLLVGRFEGGHIGAVFKGLELLIDSGNGKYSAAGLVTSPGASFLALADRRFRTAVDMDSDGDLDLPTGNGYIRNDGIGALWPSIAQHSGGDTVAAGDIDGDGDIDALSITVAGSAVSIAVQRNDGANGFTPLPLVNSSTVASKSPYLADLDDDGDLDVAVPHSNDTIAVQIFENLGGSFAQPIALGAPLGSTSAFTGIDFDADGRTDIVCDRGDGISFGKSDVVVFRRVGPGLAFEAPRFWIGSPFVAATDFDEDGDVDVVGNALLRNRIRDGAEYGVIQQYGLGTPGTGAATPTLGASGPLQPGSTTASVRVRRGLGGAPSFFFVSAAGPAAIPHVIAQGTFLVQPPVVVIAPIPLSGPSGTPSAGELDFDLSALIPSLASLSLWHQVVVLDPNGPGGYAASNGLLLQYGF